MERLVSKSTPLQHSQPVQINPEPAILQLAQPLALFNNADNAESSSLLQPLTNEKRTVGRDFAEESIPIGELINELANPACQIRTLDLSPALLDSSQVFQLLQAICTQSPTITTSLNLAGLELDHECLFLLSKLRDLNALNISHCNIDFGSKLAFKRELNKQHFPQLTLLDVRGNHGLSNYEVLQLKDALSSSCILKSHYEISKYQHIRSIIGTASSAEIKLILQRLCTPQIYHAIGNNELNEILNDVVYNVLANHNTDNEILQKLVRDPIHGYGSYWANIAGHHQSNETTLLLLIENAHLDEDIEEATANIIAVANNPNATPLVWQRIIDKHVHYNDENFNWPEVRKGMLTIAQLPQELWKQIAKF